MPIFKEQHFNCFLGEVLNQFRNVARQYSYFFRLFQVFSLASD